MTRLNLPEDPNRWPLARALVARILNAPTIRPMNTQQRTKAKDLLGVQFESNTRIHAANVSAGETVDSWYTSMRSTIGSYARQMATAGAGTIPRLPVREAVDNILTGQWTYLDRFAEVLDAGRRVGNMLSEAAIAARSLLYGSTGIGAWWRGSEPIRSGVVVYYIAQDTGNTCSNCSAAARNGPYDASLHPYPGELCLGGSRCRCTLRYEQNPDLAAQIRSRPVSFTPRVAALVPDIVFPLPDPVVAPTVSQSVAAPPVPIPDATAKQSAAIAASKTIDQLIADRGGNAADYIEKARDNFIAEIAGKKVEISLGGKSLDSVLDSGRYKNFFEVVEQFPFSDVASRSESYLNMHEASGIARDAAPSARPIYGYVNTNDSAQNAASVYGETRMILRDEIKNRVTYTPNDSMTPILDRRMVPATLANIDEAMFGSEIGKWIDTRNQSVLYNRVLYVETQIYGGVKLSDIEAIVFDYEDLRGLTPERFDRLRGANIAIQVRDSAQLFGSFFELKAEYGDYVP